MAGFTGFPFSSYNTSPSSSSTSSSASSAGLGGSFGSSPLFGAPSPPLFGSSFSSSGFSFPTPNNSSMPSNDNSTPNTTPTTDEATIRKILEAIETLEKLAKNGAFPQEKLDEIKKEVEKKYPNIFSTKKPGQNNTNNNNASNTNTSGSSSTLPNNPFGWENYYTNILNQQQEFWKNYQLNIQEQVNQQLKAQNQIMEQYMKMYSTNSGAFSPNYFGTGFNYPSYNNTNNNSSAEAWKMAFEMIGKASNDGLFNNMLGNNTGFGTDGFSALSFLGSLLGGGFGF